MWSILFLITPAIAGCYYSGGELLYVLGFGRGEKVKAEFRLTQRPLLILIDDVSGSADVPVASRYLFDSLSQELVSKKAASKIIPQESLVQLRQSMPDFEERGCREIGQRAGAEQVLWIEIQDLAASEQIQDALAASYFAVTVRVINALEESSRSRVRLWPQNPAGHPVAATLTGSEAGLAKTQDAILRDLASRLATDIAKLFYDHRLGDFERRK